MPFCATLVVAALGLCWAQQVRGDIQIPLPNHECCKVYTAFLQKEVPKLMSADKSLDAAEARAAAIITWDSRNPDNCIYGYLGACLNPASNQSLEVWAMPRGAKHAAFSPSVERSSAQIASIACARAQVPRRYRPAPPRATCTHLPAFAPRALTSSGRGLSSAGHGGRRRT